MQHNTFEDENYIRSLYVKIGPLREKLRKVKTTRGAPGQFVEALVGDPARPTTAAVHTKARNKPRRTLLLFHRVAFAWGRDHAESNK